MITLKQFATAVVALVVTLTTLSVGATSSAATNDGVRVGASVESSQPAAVQAQRRGRTYYVRDRKYREDRFCEKVREARNEPGPCERVLVFRSTNDYRYVAPRQAARGNAIWCADWALAQRGIYYINWKEEIRGTFCWYEGPSAPRVFKNSYKCGYGHSIGSSIEVTDCWHERRYGDTTYGWWISDYDKFKVTAIASGFPVSATYQMHVNLHPTGNMYGYYS